MFVVSVCVILIRNFDIKDGLVNGVMGYIFYFVNGKDNDVLVVVVIFDNKNVGKKIGRWK